MIKTTTPEPERAHLRFVEEVLAAFDFLATEYEFHLAKVEITFVRYESRDVFVNVYHGRASFELNCEIGYLTADSNHPERPFYLGEILDLMGGLHETGYTFFQASSAERVKQFVPKVADLIKHYAKSALEGDPTTFKRLADLRWAKSRAREKQETLIRTREKASEAWSKKDYLKVIELFDPVRDDLTPAEIKKLEYAKKHL
ncbi:MAG TPA: hypothetical protein VNS63_13625 [Blastocatellia bacterium]|nr:hypothetical protein [Blastocatellia bacterium]